MSRYLGPRCRLCRRESEKLFLKGDRCHTEKCALERRKTTPGQHVRDRAPRISGYGTQLREKQKLRRTYGLQEQQFHTLYEKAAKKRGVTGVILLESLERRLDNIVHRMGFAASRSQARQLVRHQAILVDGSRVDVPSYQVPVGAVVEVAEKARQWLSVRAALESAESRGIAPWIEVEKDHFRGVFKRLPERDELPPTIREQLVVELYSK